MVRHPIPTGRGDAHRTARGFMWAASPVIILFIAAVIVIALTGAWR